MFQIIGIVACLYVGWRLIRFFRYVVARLKCHVCGTPYQENPAFSWVRDALEGHRARRAERQEYDRRSREVRDLEIITAMEADRKRKMGMTAGEICDVLSSFDTDTQITRPSATSIAGIVSVATEKNYVRLSWDAIASAMPAGAVVTAIRSIMRDDTDMPVRCFGKGQEWKSNPFRVTEVDLCSLVTADGETKKAVFTTEQ